MVDDKQSKNLKDLAGWEETLDTIKVKKEGPINLNKDSSYRTLPSSKELEEEWDKRIRDSSKKEELITKATPLRKPESIEEVFRQLKNKGPDQPPSGDQELKDSVRLKKIKTVVKGEAPKIRERELTGSGIPGLYKLYPMGSFPPLNLLTKLFYGMSGKSLEKDLRRSSIPLYPEEYVSFAVGIAFIFSTILCVMMLFVTQLNIPFALLSLVLGQIFISLLLVNLPSLKITSGSRDVDRQLPFALRHMASLLGAGISIFDSIVSVSKADYGSLSKELDKVVWDVKSGENLSDALEDSSERVGSRSFSRVVIHIRRALQMGGDVAKIISQIADDMTFEMRMKVSDFVEKLNAFAVVYIMGGIVGPVVISVFAVVGTAQAMQSVGGGALMDKTLLALMLLVVFPMIMVMITYLVKLMEPKV